MSLIIPLIALGVSAAGTAYSQIKANQAAKKQEDFLQQRRTELAAQFNRDYYENYLDTDSARAGLNILKKNMKKAGDVLASRAVQGGATAENVVAQQSMLQDKYQDAVNNLLDVGERRKQAAKSAYYGVSNNLDQQQQNMHGNKINSWNQLSSNISSAANNVALAWGEGAFDKTTKTKPTKTKFDSKEVYDIGDEKTHIYDYNIT